MDPQPEPVLTGSPGGGSTPDYLSPAGGSTPDYSPYNSPRPGSETEPAAAEIARDIK